ncbi:MAG: serine/threonine protein kinase, partial [Nostocaceae cyanobacterium]|nr:serine/threonine protein kinase [Nostocaceae cyanobacterium]
MEGDRCNRNGCIGIIEDGFCNACGIAPPQNYHPQSATIAPHSTPTTGTGSSPLTNRSKGSRRTGTSAPHSSRKLIGGGLVSVPELPSTEPEKAIIPDPKVPENKRFCANCNNQLKREAGFCS